MSERKHLLTAKEAREWLNVSERTFRRIRLPFVRVQGSKRYEEAELQRYITLHRRRPALEKAS